MTYKTHILSSTIITLPISIILSISNIIPSYHHGLLIILFSLIGTVFPDIDNRKAFISRFLFLNKISSTITLFIKHRGFTHSLYSIVIIMLSLLYFSFKESFSIESTIISISFIFGYILHIFLDSFTYMGIPNFFLNYNLKLGNTRILVSSENENKLYIFFIKIQFIELILIILFYFLTIFPYTT